MARTLQDFVDVAIKKGAFPENSKQLQIYIRKLVLKMRIYGKENIESLADDIICELAYLKLIPEQPDRKTRRYFYTPKRLETQREKYVFDLASICNKEYGKKASLQIKIGARAKSSKWARGGLRDDFASDFLAERKASGKLQYNVGQGEFLSMIRSVGSSKKGKIKRKAKTDEVVETQPKLL